MPLAILPLLLYYLLQCFHFDPHSFCNKKPETLARNWKREIKKQTLTDISLGSRKLFKHLNGEKPLALLQNKLNQQQRLKIPFCNLVHFKIVFETHEATTFPHFIITKPEGKGPFQALFLPNQQLIRRKFILYWEKISNPTKLWKASEATKYLLLLNITHCKFQDGKWLDELGLWRDAMVWGLLPECCANFLIFCASLSLAIKPERHSPLEFVSRIKIMVLWNPGVFLPLDSKLSPIHHHLWSTSFKIRESLENKYVLIFNMHIKMLLGAQHKKCI